MGKRYGQHFLRSARVVAGIVAGADPRENEPVLEIGPGEGVLTKRLLERGARVTAVEIDPMLCDRLRQLFDGHDRFRLVEGDILQTELAPEALFGGKEPYAVIANLPYYLSTPLLFRLIAHRAYHDRLVLMVQKEIADRLIALPRDGKAYSALSVAAHHVFRMERILDVPPEAFRPPPKVDSAVVRFEPRAPILAPDHEKRFLQYTKTIFMHRRKLMAGSLRRAYPGVWERHAVALEALVGKRRPEALTPQEHLEVFRMLA